VVGNMVVSVAQNASTYIGQEGGANGVGVGSGFVGMEIQNFNDVGVQNRTLHLITHKDGATSQRAVTVTGLGSVGIGTTSPQSKLDVAGNLTVNDTINFPAGGTINTVSGMNLQTSGTASLYLNPFGGGDVTVGSFNGDRRLYVVGNILATKAICANAGVNCVSDRNAKQNFRPINVGEVLEKIAKLPLSTWNYKSDPQTPHLGPVSQDFYAAFGLGSDDRSICIVDEGGISLAAIQGLNQKLEEKLKKKDSEIAQLKAKAARIDSLEERLNKLERASKSPGEGN